MNRKRNALSFKARPQRTMKIAKESIREEIEMTRRTTEKQRLQIAIKNPSTDSNCRFEKSIRVDGFGPKAIVEKYRKNFEKAPQNIGIPRSIEYLSQEFFGVQETGCLFHLPTSADLPIFENISTNRDSMSDTILIYFIPFVCS